MSLLMRVTAVTGVVGTEADGLAEALEAATIGGKPVSLAVEHAEAVRASANNTAGKVNQRRMGVSPPLAATPLGLAPVCSNRQKRAQIGLCYNKCSRA